MEENKKNENLQSRREFFKKAAKRTLPIIGSLLLVSIPNVVKAISPNGCNHNCSNSCMAHCKGGCTEDGCKGCCSGTCSGTCSNSSS